MKFLKFECASLENAQRCIGAGTFPPRVAAAVPYDTYAVRAKSVREGDAVVLATWRGDKAEFFAIGLVVKADIQALSHQVCWLATPGKFEVPGTGSGRKNWLEKTAFKIEAGPASDYGLPQLVAELSSDEFTRAERRSVLALMTAEGYTDSRLATVPQVCDLLGRLMEDGFTVFPTGKRRDNGPEARKGTIQVESGGHQVAYVPGGAYSPRHLIGLPVLWPDDSEPRQAVPPAFGSVDLQRLAADVGVEPAHLELVRLSGNQYVRITDFASAVKAVHATASLVDPTYSPPERAGRDFFQDRDERDIRRRHAARPAQCMRLVKARRGQGTYRDEVLAKFNGRCAVSGLALSQALRASHILAWSRCDNDDQRLDANNGLLLSADLDALFDRYLISFDRNGTLMQSPLLDPHREHHWPLGNLLRRPTDEQYAYLRRHNEVFEHLSKL
jgi:hypothetical protein